MINGSLQPDILHLKVTFNYDSKNKQGTFEIEQKQVDKEKNIPSLCPKDRILAGRSTVNQPKYPSSSIKKNRSSFLTCRLNRNKFDLIRRVKFCTSWNLILETAILRKQLTDDPTVIGRILAAQELIKSGKRNNIQAVIDAYADEPFWGVRQEIAEALGKCNNETAVAGLAQIISIEQEPRILGSVIQTAGAFRDRRIQEAVAARLKAGLPYRATQAAYESLGNQRQDAPLDLLLEESRKSGYNGIAQSGALCGLAGTRRSEAIDPLLESVGYGNTSNRARPTAVSALAEIGKGLEKAQREQVVEKLTDLLRDPWYKVHLSAARGLKAMEAPEAIPDLEVYSKNLSLQDQVTIEKIIDSLRSQDKVDGSEVKKQVEELRETIRKLEDRVENLSAKMASE